MRGDALDMFRRATVRTTVSKILAYNPKRITAVIMNIGSQTVYISQDPRYVEVNGFPIYPTATVMLDKLDGDKPELDLYGRTTTGSTILAIEEGLE